MRCIPCFTQASILSCYYTFYLNKLTNAQLLFHNSPINVNREFIRGVMMLVMVSLYTIFHFRIQKPSHNHHTQKCMYLIWWYERVHRMTAEYTHIRIRFCTPSLCVYGTMNINEVNCPFVVILGRLWTISFVKGRMFHK